MVLVSRVDTLRASVALWNFGLRSQRRGEVGGGGEYIITFQSESFSSTSVNKFRGALNYPQRHDFSFEVYLRHSICHTSTHDSQMPQHNA